MAFKESPTAPNCITHATINGVEMQQVTIDDKTYYCKPIGRLQAVPHGSYIISPPSVGVQYWGMRRQSTEEPIILARPDYIPQLNGSGPTGIYLSPTESFISPLPSITGYTYENFRDGYFLFYNDTLWVNQRAQSGYYWKNTSNVPTDYWSGLYRVTQTEWISLPPPKRLLHHTVSILNNVAGTKITISKTYFSTVTTDTVTVASASYSFYADYNTQITISIIPGTGRICLNPRTGNYTDTPIEDKTYTFFLSTRSLSFETIQ